MQNFKSYKGRNVQFNKPAHVYRNLHNGLFSIERKKNVHAFVFVFGTIVFMTISEDDKALMVAFD